MAFHQICPGVPDRTRLLQTGWRVKIKQNGWFAAQAIFVNIVCFYIISICFYPYCLVNNYQSWNLYSTCRPVLAHTIFVCSNTFKYQKAYSYSKIVSKFKFGDGPMNQNTILGESGGLCWLGYILIVKSDLSCLLAVGIFMLHISGFGRTQTIAGTTHREQPLRGRSGLFPHVWNSWWSSWANSIAKIWSNMTKHRIMSTFD